MMKGRISAATFLGGIVILVGLLLLIKNVFNLDIPVFTILLSLGLIWLGIILIKGGMPSKGSGYRTAFGDDKVNYVPGQDDYSVMFGSGTLNLQEFRPDMPVTINLECTFGEMKVLVSREVELMIEGGSSFGTLGGPDLQSASFGNYRFVSSGFNTAQPGITLHAHVSFGEMKIYYI